MKIAAFVVGSEKLSHRLTVHLTVSCKILRKDTVCLAIVGPEGLHDRHFSAGSSFQIDVSPRRRIDRAEGWRGS